MRISYKKLIIFLLLLSCNFMFILPVSIWDSLRIGSILAVALCVVKIKCVFKNSKEFNMLITFFILLCIFEIIISRLRYGQSITEIIGVSMYYFICAVYFILSYFSNNRNNEVIRNTFIVLALILSILLISQRFMYEMFGVAFLKINIGEQIRFGQVRITSGSFLICIGVIISFGKLINLSNDEVNNKLKFMYLLTVIFGLCEIILVCKTRALIIFLILSMIVMFIFTVKSYRKKIKIYFLSFLVGICVINMPIMKEYLNSAESESSSKTIRINAINYYIDQTLESPIFGAGMINASNKGTPLFYVARGDKGQYFKDDVGIIGFFNTFGILGLLWYVMFIVKILKIIVIKFKNGKIYFETEILGISVLILLSSTTLIIMDAQRIFYLPFLLVLIENKDYENYFNYITKMED